eukprot:4873637-Prymnesium_polylepis.1
MAKSIPSTSFYVFAQHRIWESVIPTFRPIRPKKQQLVIWRKFNAESLLFQRPLGKQVWKRPALLHVGGIVDVIHRDCNPMAKIPEVISSVAIIVPVHASVCRPRTFNVKTKLWSRRDRCSAVNTR